MISIKLLIKHLIGTQLMLRLLEAFGSLWLILEIMSYFSKSSADAIKPFWWIFLLIGLIITIHQSWPNLNRCHKLQNRDVKIRLIVGDIFKGRGDLVVGSNTTFDTDTQNGLISAKSVQGIFTHMYFNSRSDLDTMLNSELSKTSFTVVNKKGKSKRYPIGTTCRIPTRDFISYWLAIADLNEHGTARSTLQNLRDSLPSLWEFITTVPTFRFWVAVSK